MRTARHAEDLGATREVDILVVGGGPAGVGAGLAAARAGAKTLVVEQFNCLGGVATAGGHGHISIFSEWGGERRIVGGIAHEIAGRVVAEKFGIRNPHGIWFEVEGLKFLLDRMAKEAGLGVLYHTFFCEALGEEGEGEAPAEPPGADAARLSRSFALPRQPHKLVCGAVVQNKGGRQIIKAKRVIDCTGDGDVAFTAGCPCEVGRPGDHGCQPVTLMFTIGGVDWPKVEAWRTSYDMAEVWAEAQRRGDMEPFQKVIMGFWWTPTRPDQVGINFTHVTGVDSTNAEDLTAATIEARRQAYHSIQVFRQYVPGMEQCYMVSTPNTVGIRESRRVLGDYVLTEQDVMAGREFEDAIAYGSFFIDIHNIDGAGMDATTWRPPKGFKYQIPYRVLVPRGAENLLVAGRCISVTHVALGSTRVMVQCMATGEAAGTAAALSLQQGVPPRRVGIPKLQSLLRRGGGILSEADIAAANA